SESGVDIEALPVSLRRLLAPPCYGFERVTIVPPEARIGRFLDAQRFENFESLIILSQQHQVADFLESKMVSPGIILLRQDLELFIRLAMLRAVIERVRIEFARLDIIWRQIERSRQVYLRFTEPRQSNVDPPERAQGHDVRRVE